MKRSILTNAALAAALALVVCGLFFAPKNRIFRLEVSLAASIETHAQLFFDVGHGIREEDSADRKVPAGGPTTLRFELPTGNYRHLRFDPLGMPGTATVSELTLFSPTGAILRRFRLADFQPGSDLTVTPRPDGMTEIIARNGDPMLDLPLPEPIVLRHRWTDFFS
ncbi:MAG: hypothetical protein ABIZ49_08835, partial [Opitutaceae bacterium]